MLKPIEDAVVLDHCKVVCLRTAGCSNFSFSPEDGCRLTCAKELSQVSESNDSFTGSVQSTKYQKVTSDLSLGYVDYVEVSACADLKHIERRGRYMATNKVTCRYLCDLEGKSFLPFVFTIIRICSHGLICVTFTCNVPGYRQVCGILP